MYLFQLNKQLFFYIFFYKLKLLYSMRFNLKQYENSYETTIHSLYMYL